MVTHDRGAATWDVGRVRVRVHFKMFVHAEV